jgi:hypothetical protein
MAVPQALSPAEREELRLAHERQQLRQVRWRLRMTVAQRIEVNRKAYRLRVIGQRNHARKLAARRAALTNAS